MGDDLLSQIDSQDRARLDPRGAFVEQSDNEADLALKVQRDVDGSAGVVETWRQQGAEDSRYYSGSQWSDMDRMRLEQQKRPALVFNEIGDKIDALSGLERINRTDIRFVSRSPNTDIIHDAAGDLASDSVSASLDLCLVGSTRVQAGRNVRKGFSRLYKGRLIEIECSNGNRLTGTPNHPVLTLTGWIKLGQLREGDHIIDGAGLLKQFRPLEHYFDDVETSIEDRVKSLSRNAAMSSTLATRTEDFHGDGTGSEIHTVWTNRFLMDDFQSFISKQVGKLGFDRRNWKPSRIRRTFAGLSLNYGTVATPTMSGFPFSFGQSFAQGADGFGGIAQFDTSKFESSSNHLTGDFELSSQIGSADAALIERYKFGRFNFLESFAPIRNLLTIAKNIAMRHKPLGDSGGRNGNSLRDCVGRQLLVEIESGEFFRRNRRCVPPTLAVSKVTVVNDAICHVYNLETSSGFYIANGVLVHNCDGEKETSRIAKDVAITGMGWGEVFVSFEDDVDGRVVFQRHNPFEFSWDKRAEKENLEDTNWRARIRDFPRSLFKARWPDKLEMVDASAPSYPEYQVGKYELVTPYYSRENERVNPQVGQQNAPKKTVRVIQYQWKDQVTIYRIADPANPEGLQELSEAEWKSLQGKAMLMGAPVPHAVRQLKTIYKQVYVACGIVLEEPLVLPNGFSLLCFTGQWDNDKKTWYGVVRGLKDPQNTVNKAISSLVTQFITNVKGGVIYKQGTFTDPTQVKGQWAQPDAFIEASSTANLSADIMQRVPSQVSPAPPLLFSESKAAIARQSGINEDMLGFGASQASGPAIGKRIQSALAILGWFFDNLERFRKAQARTMLEFIREYWSYGQLIRVGGDFNSKAIPLLKSELPLSYDLVVDQSVKYNPNLKQQIWSDLMQIAGPLMKSPIGQQFLLKALKFSPLPVQLVAELQELAQQAAQAPQKQGRGKSDPPELTQAKVVKMNADAQKAIAEAKALDKRSGTDLAKLVSDVTLRSGELQHKRFLEEKKALLQRSQAAQGVANGAIGQPTQAP